MAFIRSYAAQGDPFLRSTMRAGQLVGMRQFAPPRGFGKRGSPAASRPGFTPAEFAALRGTIDPRMRQWAGDPFLGKFLKRAFKPPKFIRKLQPLKAVANVVKKVAPIAASLVPGLGGIAAGLIASKVATAAPPPVAQAEPVFEAAEPLEQQAADAGFTPAQLEQLLQILMFLRGGA